MYNIGSLNNNTLYFLFHGKTRAALFLGIRVGIAAPALSLDIAVDGTKSSMTVNMEAATSCGRHSVCVSAPSPSHKHRLSVNSDEMRVKKPNTWRN